MLKQIQRLPFAPVVALMFAGVAAVLVMATPVWLLEQAVWSAGLPDLLPAAAPPLGLKARLLLILAASGGAGCAAFLLAWPFRDRAPRVPQVVTVPPLRAEPTAPAAFSRPSVFAPQVDDEPNLPRFLAEPLAQMRDAPLPIAGNDDDELLLDAMMIVAPVEALDVAAVPVSAPVPEPEPAFVAAVRNIVEDVPQAPADLPPMPEIFVEAETVLHLEPAPVPPPADPYVESRPVAPRPRIVEHREPTIAELMERFQRGLETLKRAETSPLDDPALRHALGQLERLAVGGR